MTSNTKTIALGADHAGFEYKNAIKHKLEAEGYNIIDMGTHSIDSVDYPDFVHPVAESVEKNHPGKEIRCRVRKDRCRRACRRAGGTFFYVLPDDPS